jgi:hypothetical protein
MNNKSNDKIWACLLHLSFNFAAGIKAYGGIRKEFELDETLWRDALKRMAEKGLNMVLINVEDSVKWNSHPEIATRNAWSVSRLREELDKIRQMGIEPIPMLNFSTTHDAWLGKYSRMVSTKIYYQVCSNLISEMINIFDKPRFFHLGMDEESAPNQRRSDFVVVRQNNLWWADFYFFIAEVEKGNVRPWVWSDYVWHHPEEFYKKMPKSVIQSNWYYGEDFSSDRMSEGARAAVKAYGELNQNGYDQIPTGSNHLHNPKSIENTVKYCKEHIDASKLLGFLQTFWKPTIDTYRSLILEGIDMTGEAKIWFEKNQQ